MKGISDEKAGRERGSILGKLLLLIVIVSVLAVVLSPCPCRRLSPGRATRAVSEINNIELALTKALSDAGQSNLRAFFSEAAFNDAVSKLGRERNMDAFTASIEIYTYSTYALLRKGRHALEVPNDYAETLNADVVGSLDDSYYSESARDPWGNLYQVFAGPWPDDMGPVHFRKYLPSAGGASPGESPELPDMLRMEGID